MSQQDATSQAETHSATDELKRVIKYCFWEFGQEENVPEDRLDRYFCIVSYLTQAGVKLPDAFEEHGGKVALFKALIVGGRAWMNQENEIERRTRYNGLIKLAEVCYERLFGEVFDEYTVQESVTPDTNAQETQAAQTIEEWELEQTVCRWIDKVQSSTTSAGTGRSMSIKQFWSNWRSRTGNKQ